MIYDARSDARVILHAHTLSLKNAITTKKAHPYGTLEFAKSAVDILKTHDLVILKEHGFVSIGNTVEEAFQKIQ
jgi:ribulose-5-phosphate 4-epimerase/fuculose-1-phosphate aldolase